jgi:hypothetical protein
MRLMDKNQLSAQAVPLQRHAFNRRHPKECSERARAFNVLAADDSQNLYRIHDQQRKIQKAKVVFLLGWSIHTSTTPNDITRTQHIKHTINPSIGSNDVVVRYMIVHQVVESHVSIVPT